MTDYETTDQGGKQAKIEYRADLVPPLAMLRAAGILKMGADRYGEGNWKKISIPSHLNHAISHLFLYLSGDQVEDHLAHATCRLMFALDLKESGKIV